MARTAANRSTTAKKAPAREAAIREKTVTTSGSTPRDPARKVGRFNLRLSPDQETLLRAASDATQTTISDFVLRSATRAAEDALADKRVFVLETVAWEELAAALERPAADISGLRELMTAPSILQEREHEA